MLRVAQIRIVLVAILVVGALGAGVGTTFGEFTDTETTETNLGAAGAFEGDFPSSSAGYNDSNGNGRYDAGEQTYTKSEIRDFNEPSADLVIPKSVGDIDDDNEPISITAGSITSSVNLSSRNEGVHITATSGDANLGELTLSSRNNGVDITATGAVSIDNAKLSSRNNDISIRAKSISARNADLWSRNNEILLSARQNGGGPIDAAGARFETRNNRIILESSGDISLDSAQLYWKNKAPVANLGVSEAKLSVNRTILDESGGTLTYAPDDITVQGTPDKGAVSP